MSIVFLGGVYEHVLAKSEPQLEALEAWVLSRFADNADDNGFVRVDTLGGYYADATALSPEDLKRIISGLRSKGVLTTHCWRMRVNGVLEVWTMYRIHLPCCPDNDVEEWMLAV